MAEKLDHPPVMGFQFIFCGSARHHIDNKILRRGLYPNQLSSKTLSFPLHLFAIRRIK